MNCKFITWIWRRTDYRSQKWSSNHTKEIYRWQCYLRNHQTYSISLTSHILSCQNGKISVIDFSFSVSYWFDIFLISCYIIAVVLSQVGGRWPICAVTKPLKLVKRQSILTTIYQLNVTRGKCPHIAPKYQNKWHLYMSTNESINCVR